MNTISKLFSGAALLSVALFSSCQRTGGLESELVNPLDARDGSFTIVGNLADYKTRAHDAVWDAGDNIGVYAFLPGTTTLLKEYANLQYNTVDAAGVFKASNGGIVLLKDEKADVTAYYPFSQATQGTTYNVDVTNQSDLKKIDLLWGKGTLTADINTTTVPVKFNHKLSLIQLRFTPKAGETLPKTIKATFKGAKTAATFDVASGMLTPGDATGDINLTASGAAINLILLPGDVLSGIEFEFDGVKVPYAFETPYTLAEDTKYTFNFSPYNDGNAVVLNVQGSIEDWGNEVTFTDEIPYSGTETPADPGTEEPGTEEPGTEEPGTGDPETPALSLAFPGSDFETDPNVGTFGYKFAQIEEGVGMNGTKALHISGNSTKTEFVFSTPTINAPKTTPTKLTFWIKGTSSAKSISINVYAADKSYWGFNPGDITVSETVTAKGTTASGGFVNDYNGIINTGNEWVQITLDLTGVTLNTSGSNNTFGFKINKSEYDLYLDNIELK